MQRREGVTGVARHWGGKLTQSQLCGQQSIRRRKPTFIYSHGRIYSAHDGKSVKQVRSCRCANNGMAYHYSARKGKERRGKKMLKETKVNGLTKNVIDLTAELTEKGKAINGGFDMLNKDHFKGDGVNTFTLYKRAVDHYHFMIYDRKKKHTAKELDSALKAVLAQMFELSKVEEIVKAWGGHDLASARFAQRLTERSRLAIKPWQVKIKALEENPELTDEERGVLKAEYQSHIDGLKEYESEFISQLSERAFRKQIEMKIACILAGKAYRNGFVTIDDRTATNKWQRHINQARKYGISEETIQGFKSAVDLDGLKEAVKKARATYEAEVLKNMTADAEKATA